MIIRAPFTSAQVAALNSYQGGGRFHPYTCPGDLAECQVHDRTLTATEAGWVCACGKYSQPWAHDFHAEPRP